MATIINRHASNSFDAWKWAEAAARLGWRVVSCFQDEHASFCVWAEAPSDADPDEWDREKVQVP